MLFDDWSFFRGQLSSELIYFHYISSLARQTSRPLNGTELRAGFGTGAVLGGSSLIVLSSKFFTYTNNFKLPNCPEMRPAEVIPEVLSLSLHSQRSSPALLPVAPPCDVTGFYAWHWWSAYTITIRCTVVCRVTFAAVCYNWVILNTLHYGFLYDNCRSYMC